MIEYPIMSKSRIESFSDGVFSIVLTLLVFNFQVPKVSGGDMDVELYARLAAMSPYFITYMFSFILISMFWVAHHALFHGIKHSTHTLLWLNNLFLLFLAFIPFPTQVLGAYPDTEVAAIFFGVTMVLASLSFSGMRYYAYYRGGLAMEFVTAMFMRKSLQRGVFGAVLYRVAIGISAYSRDVTLSMYALIPFLFFVPLHLRRY